MSSRYPTGISSPWLPHSVVLIAAGARNVYGEVSADGATKDARAKVNQTVVEMDEHGAKVSRNGITAVIATPVGFTIEIGTIILWQGIRYTVIGMRGKADHTGAQHSVTVEAVVKAGQ